jgi:glutamine amidotransferase
MNLVIVDYGMGNINSIVSALKFVGGQEIIVSSDYEKLKKADKLILPGVGSFGKAMEQIKQKKIDQYLEELVLEKRKPLLGICLGMQLLGFSSTEDGFNHGLGFIDGVVSKFDNSSVKVPHVGFNQVSVGKESKLYEGLPSIADFYFTHSYRMTSDAKINQSTCHYQDDFVASFEMNNIAGTQFHPELSQRNGLQVIKNFIEKF